MLAMGRCKVKVLEQEEPKKKNGLVKGALRGSGIVGPHTVRLWSPLIHFLLSAPHRV